MWFNCLQDKLFRLNDFEFYSIFFRERDGKKKTKFFFDKY